MDLTFFKNTFLITLLVCFSCGSGTKSPDALEAGSGEREAGSNSAFDEISEEIEIIVGAERYDEYLPMLKGKNVGIVANQTSIITEGSNETDEEGLNVELIVFHHLVDFLLQKNINVKKVFAPEHGFRGTADAGEIVKDGVDTKTGLPIISLYGKNKKPSEAQLKDIDIVIFDIQDVGARFYTYISSLHYVMEACAEAGIPVIVLDRPNPNGHYIDGPIMEAEHTSFVGMHPIPVVHGMTIGEYAQMINGEGWLDNKVKCDLTVIEMENYNHDLPYSLPIKPSPNLPNDVAINLYPSLCFFEGTFVSAGRGTEMQFQIFGAPSFSSESYPFSFTPEANEGAKYPKFKGELCHGKDLRKQTKLDQINLDWLINAYEANGKKKNFFIDFFTTLAGTTQLQQQIEAGLSSEAIRETWQDGLKSYDAMRTQYMLYD
ncbi:exo-beta-N-acetylmuramidase NamZ family protein [Ulvibacter antarcticus]|uniref:Uncharacterized protein YbbC (DUF1343 family) n=1 Tax=Ulvibacter antarcticus TaxID=442714 RepID=A0A3L9Y7N1_9FLAO|nr:DUF1343 domain-containing protein [Ulvibacter antarcticus]RMA56716.1 uncharacterized protein YbbC (DUF1343 family) [Ulvibacter antarcticus]